MKLSIGSRFDSKIGRRLRLRCAAAVLLMAVFVAPAAVAQPQRRAPSLSDTLVSPEVLPDRRVTFRIAAPNAAEVILLGDWMESQERESVKMAKDDRGVWSVTVGPLAAGLHGYSLRIDGVRTIDPRNLSIKHGTRILENLFSVPGEEAAFEENREVPHGEIRIVWYRSSTLNSMRSMRIYTPPGYDADTTKRYPVLYLLHGGGDDDTAWSTVGRAGFIMDNLLAQRKAKPMVIVMSNGTMPRPANAPPPGRPASAGMAAMASGQDLFGAELMGSIIPYVEKNYRVLAGRDHRAIAGLSMGGGQTLRVALSDVERFRYIVVWSAGVRPQDSADFETRYAAFLNNPETTNRKVSLFWLGVGVKDALALTGARNLSQLLKKYGIKHEFHETGGAHTWIVWRSYLKEVAPLLFR